MKQHRPFHDPRLTPQENKACEMAFNGFDLAEIAEELDVSREHLSVVLYRCRGKGVAVRAKRPCRAEWSNEQLLAMYLKGLTYAQIACRTGLRRGTVAVRLSKARKQAGIAARFQAPPIPQWRKEEYLRLRKLGWSFAEIGRKYGVSRNSVCGALRRMKARMERAA